MAEQPDMNVLQHREPELRTSIQPPKSLLLSAESDLPVKKEDAFEFAESNPAPKKSTYIDEDLRAKFFAKEESKSDSSADNDDWQLEDDEF